MRAQVGKFNLEVGQWICFTADAEQVSSAAEKLQEVYKENQFFLVYTREDFMFETCACNLMSVEGKQFDYCPRMNAVQWETRLQGDQLFVVDRDDVVAIHGEEAVQAAYSKAEEHIEEHRESYTQQGVQLLGKSREASSSAQRNRQLARCLEEHAEKADSMAELAPILALSMLAERRGGREADREELPSECRPS